MSFYSLVSSFGYVEVATGHQHTAHSFPTGLETSEEHSEVADEHAPVSADCQSATIALQADKSGRGHNHNDAKSEEWGHHNGGSTMDTLWSSSLPILPQQQHQQHLQHQHQQRNRYEPPRVCTSTEEHSTVLSDSRHRYHSRMAERQSGRHSD